MRGSLFDEHGEAQTTSQASYCPCYLGDGLVEQNPETWAAALFAVTREIVQWSERSNASIDAVSVTAQRSSAIPVDQNGVPLYNAIMWQDLRSSQICNSMQAHTAAVYEKTGLRISPVFAAPKFSWFQQQEPCIYRNAYKLLVIPDYLIFLMTGKFVTDFTYGSRTLLMDLHSLEWDDDLLKLFKLDKEKLCCLKRQGSVIGHTTESFKSRTGIRIGTPVVTAGGDQQCAALGAGVMKNGSVQVTTGTGSFVIASSDELKLDPEMRVLCNVSAIPGKFILEASILTTSALYSWIANTLYGEGAGKSEIFHRLEEEANSSPVGSNGVITLPYFQGRGSSDWNTLAKGSFSNITLATTRGDLARSVLEGIAAEIAENVDLLVEHRGEIDTVLVAGGLTNLPLFNQIQADMYNRSILLPSNKETTSLGAWVSAAVALGIHTTYASAWEVATKGSSAMTYSPIEKNVEIYQRLKADKEHLYKVLESAGVYTRSLAFQTHATRNI